LPNLACEDARAKHNLALVDLDYRGRVDSERPNQTANRRSRRSRKSPAARALATPNIGYRPTADPISRKAATMNRIPTAL